MHISLIVWTIFWNLFKIIVMEVERQDQAVMEVNIAVWFELVRLRAV
jgi:hypothetical protein